MNDTKNLQVYIQKVRNNRQRCLFTFARPLLSFSSLSTSLVFAARTWVPSRDKHGHDGDLVQGSVSSMVPALEVSMYLLSGTSIHVTSNSSTQS